MNEKTWAADSRSGLRLSPGRAHPVYLWAGNATIELQRAKFPDIRIDTAAHLQAHEPLGAHCLARTGIDLAFLSMNWGFPPEIERHHWREFEQAVHTYRAAGLSAVGYVQASNCVSTGSYTDAAWYARDAAGRRVPYYHKRFMTCWNDPAWIREVEANALRVIAAGASGVFFDNVWMGATPWTLGRTVAGFAGCGCPRCVEAFRRDTGLEIPKFLDKSEASERYLRWRADVVRSRFAGWREAIARRAPGAIVMANNCDVVLRDTIGLFGLDFLNLAPLQDALLLENVAMPRYEPARDRLVANAVALKAVRAAVPDKPILAVTYEHGIGIDRLPSVRNLRRAVTEAVAVGAVPTLKGSEYLDGTGRFSVITAPAFVELRAALAPLLQWLKRHAWLYEDVSPEPAVLVPFDPSATGANWSANAQSLVAALSLLRAQVPFGFTVNGSASAQTTLQLERKPFAEPSFNRILDLSLFRRAINPVMSTLGRAYFGTVRARRLLDRTGLTRKFLESPWFTIPENWRLARELAPPIETPHARAETPILVERWRQSSGRWRLHLINYSDQPALVRLHVDHAHALYSPDATTQWLGTDPEVLHLDCYAVVECE
jgi:hypothetical protein